MRTTDHLPSSNNNQCNRWPESGNSINPRWSWCNHWKVSTFPSFFQSGNWCFFVPDFVQTAPRNSRNDRVSKSPGKSTSANDWLSVLNEIFTGYSPYRRGKKGLNNVAPRCSHRNASRTMEHNLGGVSVGDCAYGHYGMGCEGSYPSPLMSSPLAGSWSDIGPPSLPRCLSPPPLPHGMLSSHNSHLPWGWKSPQYHMSPSAPGSGLQTMAPLSYHPNVMDHHCYDALRLQPFGSLTPCSHYAHNNYVELLCNPHIPCHHTCMSAQECWRDSVHTG